LSRPGDRPSVWLPRTPLPRTDLGRPDQRIFKLETLPPIGAFKIRPALNALVCRDADELRHGVATESSGNMALHPLPPEASDGLAF